MSTTKAAGTVPRQPRSLSVAARKLYGTHDRGTDRAMPASGTGRLFDHSRTASPAAHTAAQTGVPVSFERTKTPRITRASFKLPNGVTVDHSRFENFTRIIANAEQRISADHTAATSALRQLGDELLELHANEVRHALEQHVAQHVETWEAKRQQWLNHFRNDPDIGRNRQATTRTRVNAVLEAYGRSRGQKRLKALREALAESWAGDNVELVRFVAWVADQMGGRRA
jgi:hypothetical protein